MLVTPLQHDVVRHYEGLPPTPAPRPCARRSYYGPTDLQRAMSNMNILESAALAYHSTTSSITRDSAMSLTRSHSSRESPATSVTSLSGTDSPPTSSQSSRGAVSARDVSFSSNSKRSSRHIQIVKTLPTEIIKCIIGHLETLHMSGEPSAYTKTLYTTSLISRAWDRVVRKQLYSTLWIHATELQPGPRKFLSKPKSRLKLLRRTLRERPTLARHVREIRLLGFPFGDAIAHEPNHDVLNAIATIVMACPGLERLTGLYPVYTHDFNRLTHALSTRTMLKEQVWLIGSKSQSLHNEPITDGPGFIWPVYAADELSPFSLLHSRWGALETLVIRGEDNGLFHQDNVLWYTLQLLPSLKNLVLSYISARDFDDSHLASLPTHLQSLRLECMPGISENGIMEYLTFTLPMVDRQHLQSLSLVEMDFHNFTSLAYILGHLYNLRRLAIVTSNLDPPIGVHVDEILQPFCSSRSLEFLHWELTPHINSPSPNFAHYLLSESIRTGGFPNLRRLRAPSDPTAALQSVCRPLAPVMADDADDLRRRSMIPTCCGSLTRHGPPHRGCYDNSLTLARLQSCDRAAEALYPDRRVVRGPRLNYSLIEEESQRSFRLYAQNYEGKLVEAYDTPAFIGDIGPGVPEYWLEPDLEGSDAGLACVGDLMRRGMPKFHDEHEDALRLAAQWRWRGMDLARLFGGD